MMRVQVARCWMCGNIDIRVVSPETGFRSVGSQKPLQTYGRCGKPSPGEPWGCSQMMLQEDDAYLVLTEAIARENDGCNIISEYDIRESEGAE